MKLFHNFFYVKKQQNPKFSQNLITEILNKVRYNIPQINIKNFNKNLLPQFLIKTKNPIFVIEESDLNECFAKSLFLANLICNFQVVIMCKSLTTFCKQKLGKFLPNGTFLQKQNLTKQQKELLYNLNINIPCQSYTLVTKNNIIINNKKINFGQNNFCLLNNEYNITQYYFNGNYYFFKNKLKNNKILIKKIFFFNKNNYLLLNKNEIINIFTNEKYYILSNIKTKIKLLKNKNGNYVLSIFANANKDFVVYIGKEKVNVFDENLQQKLQTLLQQQFASKMSCVNKKLENFFNTILPQKIVKQQIEGGGSFDFEKQYLFIKNKIISIKNNKVFFNKNYCKNFEYNFCGRTKKITFIKTNNIKKVVVNGSEYQNCESVSLNVFKKFDDFEVYY